MNNVEYFLWPKTNSNLLFMKHLGNKFCTYLAITTLKKNAFASGKIHFVMLKFSEAAGMMVSPLCYPKLDPGIFCENMCVDAQILSAHRECVRSAI